ncbi:hypothetical protein CEXT_713001 [Caerostris extrusa]|uniref:Uncharacterized protein n=1 Tax=Caerostris extrusa TaxID=172846 RepID=A0AAV4T8Z1_CAEEX|nr:hypothetical protein CEXT_713001 [Caerostris extrusa]
MLWLAEDGLTKQHWMRPNDRFQDGGKRSALGCPGFAGVGQEIKRLEGGGGKAIEAGIKRCCGQQRMVDKAALDVTRRCLSR